MRVESKKCFSAAGRHGCYNRLPIVLIIHQQFDTKCNEFMHLFNIICYELDRKLMRVRICYADECLRGCGVMPHWGRSFTGQRIKTSGMYLLCSCTLLFHLQLKQTSSGAADYFALLAGNSWTHQEWFCFFRGGRGHRMWEIFHLKGGVWKIGNCHKHFWQQAEKTMKHWGMESNNSWNIWKKSYHPQKNKDKIFQIRTKLTKDMKPWRSEDILYLMLFYDTDQFNP